MAVINGTSGNDVITGTADADYIDGLAGNDRINGGAGDDTIVGGNGADTLTGDAGNDTLYGGAGNDGFFGGGGNDTIYGEDGTDTLYGDGGDDLLNGGAGNDTLNGGTGNDQLYGGTGTNIINGGSGTDTVYINLSSSEITSAVLDDFTLWSNVMEDRLASAGGSYAVLATQTTTAAVTLSTIGLTLSGIEFLSIRVDGVLTGIEDLYAFGNQAPVAAATASAATNEDTAVSGFIAAVDPNGDTLKWTTLTGPANGSLELDALTGQYTYRPIANFNGTDSFQVAIEDPLGASVVQTVTVSVAAVNDAPVTDAAAAITTDEDTAISGQVVASDIDGDTLGYAVAQGPANGTLSLNTSTGEYIYTPAANFNGADSFQVVVADPSGATAVQTVTVGVAAVNDAPVADAAAAASTNEDTAISGQVVASDIDGDTLGYAVATDPANGTLTLNASTGAYTYTPGANFNGTDSFQVVVADPSGAAVVQTVTVGVAAVNDQPVTGAASSIATDEDKSISGQVVASDIDGDTLGYAVAQGPANGTLSLNTSTGEYIYTPAANFNGADSFQVVVADPSGATAVQTVTVGVAAVNDAPVADAASSISTSEDHSVSGAVAATDVDGDALTWSLAQGPQNGVVTLNAATGEYIYAPAANFSGDDAFDVTVADASGATSLQRVSVTVSAVADVPTLTVVNPIIVPAGVVLAGLNTSETLTGSAGSDTISGNAGNDVLDGNGATAITVGLDIASALGDLDGSESLQLRVDNVPAGGTLSAGTQNQDGSWSVTAAQLTGLTVSASVTSGFTLNVTATSSEANGSTATATASIEVILSPDANFISGGTGNDTMTGGTGNDTMYGNSGNDTISGGSGDDKIYGGKNNDTMSGGDGNDYLNGNSGDDVITGDAGNDTIIGGSGFDTLDYSNVASAINVDLSKKTVTGLASGNDTISGIEKIIGSAFDNVFKGSKDADQMDGGAGNDWLRGLGGADILKGGSGSDTFFWEKTDVGAKLGVDHITDFGAGDILDFKKLVSLSSKPLTDFVKVTDGAAGSTIAAKINGVFVDVAILDGVHGTSASDLLANGHLLVG